MNATSPTLDNIVSSLNSSKKSLFNRYGLTKIGVFGSVVRGQATASSDVDIVVQTKVPDLFMMVHLKEELESLLGFQVDLVRYKNKMNPYLKKRIDHEAHYV